MVNEKNTKKEILAEYKELKKALERGKKENEKTKTASIKEPEKETTGIDFDKSFNRFSDQIAYYIAEAKKEYTKCVEELEDIEVEISLRTNKLKDLEGIEASIYSLEDLVKAHALERQSHEEAISDCTDRFQKQERDLKEKIRRETEQYEYDKKITRQRDKDEWARAKEECMAGLKQREEAVNAKQDELEKWKKQAEQYDAMLENEVDMHVKRETMLLQRDYEHKFEQRIAQHNIKAAETGAELKNLRSQNESQQATIAGLMRDLASANAKIEEIAKQAIQGASKQKVVVQAGGKDEK